MVTSCKTISQLWYWDVDINAVNLADFFFVCVYKCVWSIVSWPQSFSIHSTCSTWVCSSCNPEVNSLVLSSWIWARLTLLWLIECGKSYVVLVLEPWPQKAFHLLSSSSWYIFLRRKWSSQLEDEGPCRRKLKCPSQWLGPTVRHVSEAIFDLPAQPTILLNAWVSPGETSSRGRAQSNPTELWEIRDYCCFNFWNVCYIAEGNWDSNISNWESLGVKIQVLFLDCVLVTSRWGSTMCSLHFFSLDILPVSCFCLVMFLLSYISRQSD